VAAACLAWGGSALAASLVVGEALYGVCAGCHGFAGEGQSAVHAPNLTGLEDWYLARQLSYFREGIRGAHADDVYGQQMAPFALSLPDDRAIEDVVAYIASLPRSLSQSVVSGDPERGRAQYALCSACHGADARGNEQLSAPALVGLDDWYVVRQLELYRDGQRGAHPQDTYGRQMQAIVGTLGDVEQLRDLARYLTTLDTP
jgi:cytochrome c oxidase subunit II